MTHDDLRKLGFLVELLPQASPLPDAVLQHYPNIPADYLVFISRLRSCHSPTDTTWLLTPADYQAQTETAFAWNEFEQLSLEAACKPEETQAIQAFGNAIAPSCCVSRHITLTSPSIYTHTTTATLCLLANPNLKPPR